MTQRSDLQIIDNTNKKTIPVVINDALGLIAKSPMVTQVFLQAVATVITRVIGGVVTSVVVEIGAISKEIEIQTHRQQITIRISKLEVVTEECAKAVRKAEMSNFPEEMRQELIGKLYDLFYEEMANIAPHRV